MACITTDDDRYHHVDPRDAPHFLAPGDTFEYNGERRGGCLPVAPDDLWERRPSRTPFVGPIVARRKRRREMDTEDRRHARHVEDRRPGERRGLRPRPRIGRRHRRSRGGTQRHELHGTRRRRRDRLLRRGQTAAITAARDSRTIVHGADIVTAGRHGLVTGQRVCFGANTNLVPHAPRDRSGGSGHPSMVARTADCPMVSVITGSTSFSVHGIVVSTDPTGNDGQRAIPRRRTGAMSGSRRTHE